MPHTNFDFLMTHVNLHIATKYKLKQYRFTVANIKSKPRQQIKQIGNAVASHRNTRVGILPGFIGLTNRR